jgi:uncharacterized membrane protein YsdA (DUF1294 family)
MSYFYIYLFLINATGFALMLADKRKAIKGHWRISERTLLSCAILGGSIGCLAGMHLVHHKTRHLKFTVGIPVILAIQLIGFILLYTHWA